MHPHAAAIYFDLKERVDLPPRLRELVLDVANELVANYKGPEVTVALRRLRDFSDGVKYAEPITSDAVGG